jgi:hypothetical protein
MRKKKFPQIPVPPAWKKLLGDLLTDGLAQPRVQRPLEPGADPGHLDAA